MNQCVSPQGALAEQIYLEHSDLVSKWVRYAHRRYPPLRHCHDLESYIVEVLWRAAVAFRPDKGARFSTFAHYRVRGAIIDLVRKRCRARDSLDQPHPRRAEPDSLDRVSSNQAQDPEHHADVQRRVSALIEVARRRICAKSFQIIWEHCVLEKSLRSIARDRGTSYHEVRTLFSRALAILRPTSEPSGLRNER